MSDKDVIKVVLSYKDEIRTIELPKYAKLKQIKKKAYELFYPIKTEIDIKYNNKTLSSLLEQSLGNIMGNKSFVRLYIIPLPGVTRSLKIKPIKNKKLSPLKIDNPSHQKNTIDNKDSLLTPRIIKNPITIKTINKTKQNELRKSYDSEKIKNEKIKTEENIKQNIYKTEPKTINYEDLHLKKTGKKKLPPIKTDNQEKKNDAIGDNKCSKCLKNIISEYCKNCNSFLCLNCTNNYHFKEGHKFIEIDDNEKINISKYKVEINKNLYDSLNYFNNTTIDTENDNIDIEKSKINYETLIKNLGQACEKLIDNLNEEEEEEDFNDEEIKKEFKIKINKINDELKNENFEEKVKENGISVFKELFNRDKNINKLIKDYKCDNSSDLAVNKLQNYFKDIENEIDGILFDLEAQIDIEQLSNLQNNENIINL